MSWATKIFLLYIGFVVIILTLVFTCVNQKVELESKDYYAKEITFQKQIDASVNLNSLEQPLEFKIKGKSVEITIPKLLITRDFSGTVNFIRPSDATKDKLIELAPDKDGKQVLSDPSFIRGVYKVQVAFSSSNKDYFKEETVFLE